MLVVLAEKMFCGGSFKCKTVEKNDEYKLVKMNNRHIKIFRSSSVSKTDKPQGLIRHFILPPKLPEDDTVYFMPKLVS